MLLQEDYLDAIRRRLQGQDDSQNQNQDQNNISTGDYLNSAIQNMAQRKAPPSLQPASRVVYADPNIASHDNFTNYYTNMGLTDQIGKNALDAENAKAAYRRQQLLNSIGNGTGVSNSGGGAVGNIPSNPAANFKFAQNIAPQFGWGPQDLAAWYTLGNNESGWNNNAQNPTSTAYGIGQFLDSTWGGYGIPKTSDPQQQVLAMARYIKARYGSPSNALSFWYAQRPNHWY